MSHPREWAVDFVLWIGNEIHGSTGFLWNADGGVIPTSDGAPVYNREDDDVRLRLFLSAKGRTPREQFANGCNMQCPCGNCKV